MKKLPVVLSLFFLVLILQNCGENPPTKSIEALIQSFDNASTSAEKYRFFSDSAKKEGNLAVANFFETLSKTETIHAYNFKKVLENLKIVPGKPVIGVIDVNNSKANIKYTLDSKYKEAFKIMPNMIEIATDEHFKDAIKVFRWAKETSKNIIKITERIHKELKKENERSLNKIWYVCPTCGNIYTIKNLSDACDLCSTNSERYIKFELK